MSRALTSLLVLTVTACGPAAVLPEDDAGTNLQADAAVPVDAGTSLDAGRNDAGALVPDAGTPDAGIADAGAPADAGPVDAGPLDAGAPDAGPTLRGVLVGGEGALPGGFGGVRYTSALRTGITDATGAFSYVAGEQLTFVVGDVAFRPLAGAPMLSPWQLVTPGTCTHSAELEKALVLLLSLDADGLPSNGTALPSYPAVTPTRPLSTLSLADVRTVVMQLIPGRTPLTVDDAVDRFIRQVNFEVWTERGVDTFAGTTALTRGQGVASDGTSWFFSGTLSLERTSQSFAQQQVNNFAIPPALALAGSKHIGDIDVFNGTLYAPIEDGSAYLNPKLVRFDPQSLTAGTVFPIPYALQTKGVPWVAVNGPAAQLIFAEWDPTTQLNLFTLSTVTLVGSLPLHAPAGLGIGRIQGGKVFEGSIYLASDDATKSLFKVDLETGTVLRLFSINTTGEQEGLTFFARPDGTALHTLNVTATSTGAELRHHQRTQLPVRKSVCP